MSRGSARKALKRLSRRRAESSAELEAVFREGMSLPSDRATVLITVAMLEDVLHEVIVEALRKLTEDEHNALFDPEMPLGTFSAKIKMAYAMKLCERQDADDLNCVREIRNAFAHATIPLTLATPEVSAVASQIAVELPSHLRQLATGPRADTFRFVSSSIFLAARLISTQKNMTPAAVFDGLMGKAMHTINTFDKE